MTVLMIILSVLMMVGGVLCMASPAETFMSLGWIAGVAIVVVGVSAIFRYAAGKEGRSIWELIAGIVGVLFGGFIIFNRYAQVGANIVIAYAAAVWLIVCGICGISEALKLRKANQEIPSQFRTAGWLVVMILGVLTAILGVVCIFQPWITMVSVGILVGVSILISGIKTLILSIQIMRNM